MKRKKGLQLLKDLKKALVVINADKKVLKEIDKRIKRIS